MPPHIPLRGAAFFFLLALSLAVTAQKTLTLSADGTLDSIAVTGYAGDPLDVPGSVRADWLHIDGAVPSFRFTSEADPTAGLTLALDELIVAGIEQYLDQRIHFTKQGVHIDIPVHVMVEGIDRMISGAAARFGAPPVVISEPTQQQLDRVTRIDWSKATFGVDGGEDQEKYLAIYYYVRAQRQELERQLRNDLGPLAAVDVLGKTASASLDPGRTDSVPTVCSTVFDDENFLCALDLKADSVSTMKDVQLTDELMDNIAAKAHADVAVVPDPPKLRKRDRWLKTELDAINSRIDKMDQRKELWALRDRMDNMEERVDDLGAQVGELKADRARPEGSDNPMANLSMLTGHNITVRFAAGSAEVAGQDRRLLDEVVREMDRSPKDRVLITGYTDPTGDPAANLVLSEKRAKAVRGYLLEHGVGADRLLLNYYGAAPGSGPNAAERRVEIEWLR